MESITNNEKQTLSGVKCQNAKPSFKKKKRNEMIGQIIWTALVTIGLWVLVFMISSDIRGHIGSGTDKTQDGKGHIKRLKIMRVLCVFFGSLSILLTIYLINFAITPK